MIQYLLLLDGGLLLYKIINLPGVIYSCTCILNNMLHDLCKDTDNASVMAMHDYLSNVSVDQPDDLTYVVNLKDDCRYILYHFAFNSS